MEFKHAFHVFVDNFSTIYKILVYRLIVAAITIGLSCAVIIPTLNNILSTAQYEHLTQTLSELWSHIVAVELDSLRESAQSVYSAFGDFKHLIDDKSWLVAVAVICLAVIFLIDRFLVGVGNYVSSALVNDKMAMHASSPFTITLFKNIKQSVIYSAIYAPIAFVYDIICLAVMWAIVSVGMQSLPMTLIKVFIIAALFILFSAVKFTFTTDWLPSLIHSKLNNRKALAYTFSRKGKKTSTVFSNTLILKLLSIALNVAALLFTFGAGLLITLPATALIQISFSLVNYFDNNRLKYFVDEYTVIGPKKEAPITREEFFKGED